VFDLGAWVDDKYLRKAFTTAELWPENVDILTLGTGASVGGGTVVDAGVLVADVGNSSGIDAGNSSGAEFGTI